MFFNIIGFTNLWIYLYKVNIILVGVVAIIALCEGGIWSRANNRSRNRSSIGIRRRNTNNKNNSSDSMISSSNISNGNNKIKD